MSATHIIYFSKNVKGYLQSAFLMYSIIHGFVLFLYFMLKGNNNLQYSIFNFKCGTYDVYVENKDINK